MLARHAECARLPVYVCRYRGTKLWDGADSLLREVLGIDTGASALNQIALGWALERRLKNIRYRVPVHGTFPKFQLPSFHTRMPTSGADPFGYVAGEKWLGRKATVLSYTEAPSDRTPASREVAHVPTVIPSTENNDFTVFLHTMDRDKRSTSLAIPAANCTKLRSKLYNSGVDVSWASRRGDS